MVERIVLCSCTIKQTGIRVQQIRREKDNNPDEIDNTKNQICSILALLQYETGIRRFYIIWAASLVTGVCSMIPQIFIPIASQFSRPENKGCNVGVVIAGLLTGICPSASNREVYQPYIADSSVSHFGLQVFYTEFIVPLQPLNRDMVQ